MKVTKISPQIKNKNRFNLEIDGKYETAVSTNDLLKFRLAEGDEISAEDLLQIKQAGGKSLLRDNILNYLASRPHSTFEVKQYIRKKIYKNTELTKLEKNQKNLIEEELIDEMIALKYLNDDDFAKWFLDQRLNSKNPKSLRMVQSELISKGIDRNTISELIDKSKAKEQESDNIQKVAEKKSSSLEKREKDPKKRKNKLIQYLSSKGYTWDNISPAVDSIFPPT